MRPPTLSITCADCGGKDLSINGWVDVFLYCAFDQELRHKAKKSALAVQHASFELADAIVLCRKCGYEARVICRNPRANVAVELSAEQLRAVLLKPLAGKKLRLAWDLAELDYRALSAALISEYPALRGA